MGSTSVPPSLGLEELLSPPLFEVASLLLGLVVGSFANVCIHRIPRGTSVVTPPSRCPACGKLIRPWDNVPVVSYLLLRGRCRSCGARISPRYVAVEALNAFGYLALAATRGATLQTLVAMLLVTTLIVLSLIDLEHYLLPNVITLPGIAVGLLASFLPRSPLAPKSALLAALGGYLALFLVAEGYRRLRGVEGLGQGDWKMVAMLGAFLGWEKMLLTVFLASLGGTLVGLALIGLRGETMKYKLPLGTFIGASGVAVVFLGDPLLTWYRGLLSG